MNNTNEPRTAIYGECGDEDADRDGNGTDDDAYDDGDDRSCCIPGRSCTALVCGEQRVAENKRIRRQLMVMLMLNGADAADDDNDGDGADDDDDDDEDGDDDGDDDDDDDDEDDDDDDDDDVSHHGCENETQLGTHLG